MIEFFRNLLAFLFQAPSLIEGEIEPLQSAEFCYFQPSLKPGDAFEDLSPDDFCEEVIDENQADTDQEVGNWYVELRTSTRSAPLLRAKLTLAGVCMVGDPDLFDDNSEIEVYLPSGGVKYVRPHDGLPFLRALLDKYSDRRTGIAYGSVYAARVSVPKAV